MTLCKWLRGRYLKPLAVAYETTLLKPERPANGFVATGTTATAGRLLDTCCESSDLLLTQAVVIALIFKGGLPSRTRTGTL
jgi:hypothetical protein